MKNNKINTQKISHKIITLNIRINKSPILNLALVYIKQHFHIITKTCANLFMHNWPNTVIHTNVDFRNLSKWLFPITPHTPHFPHSPTYPNVDTHRLAGAYFLTFDAVYLSSDLNTTQKVKFSIKDFFGKCDQIRSFLRIWSHLLKKSLMKNFIFSAV